MEPTPRATVVRFKAVREGRGLACNCGGKCHRRASSSRRGHLAACCCAGSVCVQVHLPRVDLIVSGLWPRTVCYALFSTRLMVPTTLTMPGLSKKTLIHAVNGLLSCSEANRTPVCCETVTSPTKFKVSLESGLRLALSRGQRVGMQAGIGGQSIDVCRRVRLDALAMATERRRRPECAI